MCLPNHIFNTKCVNKMFLQIIYLILNVFTKCVYKSYPCYIYLKRGFDIR